MKTLLAVVALMTSASAFAHGGIVDLSVYDRTDGRRLQVYWHEGRAWIAGRPGNEYQVTLRSRQAQDVLAVVSVDGVNVITGQTADPSQSGYVLAPRGGLDILGWRKNLSQTAAFYFTALPDSYAARTGRPDNVGVVGVALFRRKVEPVPLPQPYGQVAPPAAERRDSRSEAASGTRAKEDRLGTGARPAGELACGPRRLRARDQRAGGGRHPLLRQPPEPARARHHPRSAAFSTHRRAATAALPGVRSRSRRLSCHCRVNS